jgi:hypothetical protein
MLVSAVKRSRLGAAIRSELVEAATIEDRKLDLELTGKTYGSIEQSGDMGNGHVGMPA